MNLPRIYLIAILLLSIVSFAKSQELPKAELVDEFGITCSEMVMASYDGFLSRLYNDPSANGLVLFYGDHSSEGRNFAYFNYLSKFYPMVRRFNDSRLMFVRAPNQEKTKVQFWLVPQGALDPSPAQLYRPSPVTATTRYDVAAADFHRIKGKTRLYWNSFHDLGCDFAPHTDGFVEHLKKDRTMTGYLVIYTEFGKGRSYGSRIANFAVNDLVKNSKISRTRVKTIYGGNRSKPQIEFWLVPSGDKLPTIRQDPRPVSK